MAIRRDTGFPFPVLAGISGTVPSTAVTTPQFSTAAATTLIVVRVALSNSVPTTQHPVAVAWNGATPAGASTFTKQVEASGNVITGSHNASIWTATCSQILTNQAIDITAAAASTGASLAVTVDALVGASTVVGASNSNWWNGSGTVGTVTVNGIQSKSWIFSGIGCESVSTVAAAGGTIKDHEISEATGPTTAACGINTDGIPGNIVVGFSTSSTWGGIVAYEVLQDPSFDSPSETLGFSDSQNAIKYRDAYTVFQQNAFQSDAFAMLGGGAGPAGPSGSETDTLGLSDIQGSKQTQVSSETDTLGFSDSQVATKGATATQGPETLGFSDSQAAAAGKASSETDTLGFSDSQDATVGGGGTFSGSQSDTLGFSDSQVAAAGKAASQTDTLGFSDPQAAAKAATATQVDTLGFSDVQSAAAGKSSQQTDTLGFSDGQDAVIGKAVTLSEALGMADAYAAAVSAPSLSGTQTDTLGLGDAYAAANSAIQGAHTDTLGMGDAYAAAVSGTVVFQQRFHVWNGSTWV